MRNDPPGGPDGPPGESATVPLILLESAVPRGAAALREALDLARDAVLAARHGRPPLTVARELASVADALVRAVARHGGWPPGAALFAVGGYGRGDLSPFSDLDLLVFARRRTGPVREAAAALTRTLWDCGLPVHLTVRSAAGALRAMVEDHTAASSFLDRRLLLGGGTVAGEFDERVVEPFLRGHAESFLEQKRDEARRRRARRAGCHGELEPDVKEAPGGLRDLHFLRWERLAEGGPSSAALLPGIPRAQAAGLEEAYGTLLRYRCELHLHAGRRQDLLDLGVQRELVEVFTRGGAEGDPERPERGSDPVARHIRAMAPWFHAARKIGLACDARLVPRDLEPMSTGSAAASGAIVGASRLDGTSPTRTVEPTPRPRAGPLAAGPDATRAACRHGLLAEDLPATPADLVSLLQRPGPVAPILRRLHEMDRLAVLLPEWGAVTALGQPDPYHAYTVDEHTLRALEALDLMAQGGGPGGTRLREALAALPTPRPLRLALLLHDIGKIGGSRGHARRGAEAAADVPLRLGLPPAEARLVLRLIEHHTLLGEASALAVRGDDAPLRAVAEGAGDVEGLRNLMLITAADIGGVGHGAWSGWRAAQLIEFHDRVAALMKGPPEGVVDATSALEALLAPRRRSEARDLLRRAPAGYELSVDPSRSRLHLDLLRRHARTGGRPIATLVPAAAGSVDVVVVAADRPHLFADLAGSLTLDGRSILAAEAFTLSDGLAVDTFTVAGPVAGRRALMEALATAAAMAPGTGRDPSVGEHPAAGEIPGASDSIESRVRRFAARIPMHSPRIPDASIHVRRDPDAMGAGVFRVECPDRPGLLHDLARALSSCGANLQRVRVATLGPRALDAFHVQDQGAPPMKGPATERLLQALRSAAAPAGDMSTLPGM